MSIAAHTDRVRRAGGKRTSVDLTAAALVDLEALRSTGNRRLSTSATICAALATAANMRCVQDNIRNLTTLEK